MKTILFAVTLALSASAFAAPATTTRTTSSTTQTTTTTNTTSNSKPLFIAVPTERKVYFSTNFIGIAKGLGNVSGDFFVNNRVSANIRYQGSSAKEWSRKSRAELSTDRSMYGLGASFWVNGNEAKSTVVINPFLGFGTKKDAAEVESLSGIGLKASYVHRITPDFGFEGGLAGNTLDDGDFKGDIYGGIGFMF